MCGAGAADSVGAMSVPPFAAAAGVAVVVALAAAAPSSAAPAVRFAAPAADASLTGGGVTVRLRTDRAAPRLRVTVYGRGGRPRDVSARFAHGGDRAYAGRLRLGRELRIGRNSVFAQVRGQRGTVVARHFTVARRARGGIALQRVAPGRPLTLRVRAPGRVLRARLNRRDVGSSFERGGRGRWSAALTVHHGLRFGRNRLDVTVFAGNRFRRVRRSYVVGRGRPIADAGRDRRIRAGDRVQLDGRRTRAGRPAELRMRWRIVQRPKGAHPRLRYAAGARPQLITDRNGRYRVELSAAHRPGGVRASAAQAGPASVDAVAIDAVPGLPPAGTTLQTVVSQGGQVGVSVAGTFYAMPAGAAVQLVEIDRTSLAVTSTGFAAGDEQALTAALSGLDDRTLVVLSGGGRGPYSAPPAVQQAITRIGGTLDDYGDAPVGVIDELTNGNGGWSVIGIPGTPQGQAYQLIGLQQSAATPAGAMNGVLREASSGVEYVFDWAPAYLPYDTSETSTATSNLIDVAGTDYASSDLPFPDGRNARVGYQLLWLDADTLAPRLNATYDADPASSYSYTAGDHGMNGLLDQLRTIRSDPKPGLLFLNTIGSVPTLYYNAVRNTSDGNDARGVFAARITTLLEELGANRWAFILHGSGVPGPGAPGGYSLVGVTGLRYLKGPNAAAQLSTRLSAGTVARLAGVLERSRQGVVTAGSSGAPGPADAASSVQPDLGRILAEPDQPFTPFDGPAQSAAEAYIAEGLDLDASDPELGIRANYWTSPDEDWDGLAQRLTNPDGFADGVQPCTDSPCAAGFEEVKATLASEFLMVESVRDYFTSTQLDGLADVLASVFQQEGDLGLNQMAQDIRGLYDLGQHPSTGPDALGILGGSLGIVGGLGEFVPVAGEEIAAATEVTAGITEIVGATSDSATDGGASFDPYGFHTTVTGIQDDLYAAYQQALNSLVRTADLLVSDAGRLRAAARLIALDGRQGGWEISSDAASQLKARLTQTLRQYMWLTLGQPVLATYECAVEEIDGVRSHNPDAVMVTNVNFPQLKSPDNRRYHEWWNLYPTFIVLGNRNAGTGFPDVTSKKLTGPLFGTPDLQNYPPGNDQVGFRREYLFDRARATYGPNSRGHFDYDIQPTTPGLIHKTMNMSGNEEDSSGLAHRDNFSMYTPSCGNGQKLRWSDPDPQAPDSLDPTVPPEGDPGGAQFDVPFNPYKNP